MNQKRPPMARPGGRPVSPAEPGPRPVREVLEGVLEDAMALDLDTVGREIGAVLEKHQVPVQMRFSFLIGMPIGVLKSMGMSDENIRNFVNQTVDAALIGASDAT